MKLGLQQKILIPTLAAVVISMALSIYFTNKAASNEIWNSLTNSSAYLVDIVRNGLENYADDIKNYTATQAKVSSIQEFYRAQTPSDSITKQAKSALIEFKNSDSAIQAVGLLNTNGDITLYTEEDISGNLADRDYFKRALSGETNLSQPLISKISGKPSFIVAAPVKSDNQVVGVIYARVDLSKFSENMIQILKIGETGYAFAVDRTGMVFSHKDSSLVLKYTIADQDWGRKILANESGMVNYEFKGVSKTAIYSREKTTGWTIIVLINDDDIAKSTSKIQNASFIFGGIGLVSVCIIIMLIIRNVITSLSTNVNFAKSIASGDLDVTLKMERTDELGTLSDALKTMVSKLKEMIQTAVSKTREAEEQTALAQQATARAEAAQAQAERARSEGMLHAANTLDGIVGVVSSASEELSAQIEESSRGAEEQSKRIAETATAMEEMNATVLEVAKSASNAAQTADEAKSKALEGANVVGMVVKGMEDVRQQSHAMTSDMDMLGKQAEGIGQIMNVISDIADQTNLLALNAAIEAARAGEAGRGFAVVADEVRKLAEKTMVATKEVGDAIRGIQDGTRKNIENVERSKKNIETATELANKSGASLQEIVSLVESTTDQVRSIATASEQQSSASEGDQSQHRGHQQDIGGDVRRHAPIGPGRWGTCQPVHGAQESD